MSETKIVSLENRRDGRVVSSIVPMKNGKWLEIKKHYEFMSHKHVFDTEEDWLKARNEFNMYEVVRNQREPRMSREEKWEKNPISSFYKDALYLSAVADKYGIKLQEPEVKTDLLGDKQLYESTINILETYLTRSYPEEELKRYSELLEIRKKELAEIEARIKTVGDTTRFQEFYPLKKSMTLAYVQMEGKMLPISYCRLHDVLKIVFEGKSAETFAELNLPDRPCLWIKKRCNKLLKVV